MTKPGKTKARLDTSGGKTGFWSSLRQKAALRIAWRVTKWTGLVGLLGLVAGIGTLAAVFAIYGSDADLPDVKSIGRVRTKQVTRVFASDGQTLIGEVFDERRTMVPYDRLPRVLLNAVVAAEDARFFQHEGLNVWGMVRALFVNLKAGRYAQGGSTITQQVVKTFFLSPKRTMRRKVQEVILARRLEQSLSKEQILELYLNQIYFGHGRYGVQEASRFYFGKDVEDIGLAEASILAGLPQSPERLSPIKHPKRARDRQRYVLRQMVKERKISQSEADRVAKAKLPLRKTTEPLGSLCAEYVTSVRRKLVSRFGHKALPYLGLTVVTSCDVRMQQAARDALESGLRDIDQRQRVLATKVLSPPQRQKLLAKLRKTQGERLLPGRVYKGLLVKLDDAAGTATVALGTQDGKLNLAREERYNPKGLPPSKLLRPGSTVYVTPESSSPPSAVGANRKDLPLKLAQGPQGALVVLDVATREVRAMVGGYGQRVGDFNRVLEAVRQPGSTFKPIVFAAALEDRKITAATRLPDAPHPCENWLNIRARGHKKYLGHLRIREALARSVNSIACRVFEQVGQERVRKLAAQLGIRSPLTEHLSLALGASGIRPLELAGAFAAFPGDGTYQEPRLLRQVGALPVDRPEVRQVLSPEVSFLMSSLLTSVVQRGTGRRARGLGQVTAGKTGTSNQNRDAWFVGFTPELVAVVWVGHDDFRPLGRRETGGVAAAPIWLSFMKKTLGPQKGLGFSMPPSMETRYVDSQTGLALPEGAVGAQREYFLPGTAPEPARTAPVDPGEHVIQDDEE